MYWVRTRNENYVNISHYREIMVMDNVDHFTVCALTQPGVPVKLERFKTETEARAFLDDLIHKAMKGF